MYSTLSQENTNTFNHEMEWLSDIIDQRLNQFFDPEITEIQPFQINPPDLENDPSNYALFIKEELDTFTERILVALALAHLFKPEIFDRLQIKNKVLGRPFTEFGGKKDPISNAFVPTLRTIAFLLFQGELLPTLELQSLFENDHFFRTKNIISLQLSEQGTILDSTLSIGDEFLMRITLGKDFRPSYTSRFPASLIETPLDWEDLVLEDSIRDEIKIIDTWLKHKEEIANSKLLEKKINKGYKCLFYGTPGTGKTLTASLLGKKNKLDVYRVDLSQVVSKYIGETEKNLGSIFDVAENKNWILFFDEAESLFSKRTAVSDSKDKYANQETAYLLQRVENYKGLIIMATNLKPNIDIAFSRRIQSMVYYAIPSPAQRKQLWEKALEGITKISAEELKQLANKYELSGGSIKNIIQYAWLIAKEKNCEVNLQILLMGIRRELNKDGKTFEKD